MTLVQKKNTNGSKLNNKNANKKSVKNEDTDDDIDDDFEKKLDTIRQSLHENYIIQKKLMNEMKELLILHKKQVKVLSKISNKHKTKKHTGFNKPEPVPKSLKQLLNVEEDMLPRSKIAALMYKYFTDNKLYSTNTKKKIIPNDKLKKVFGMKENDILDFYNLQTWLKKVYSQNVNNNILEFD